jgi:hypothetical protein
MTQTLVFRPLMSCIYFLHPLKDAQAIASDGSQPSDAIARHKVFTVHPSFTRATFIKKTAHPISLAAFKSIAYLCLPFSAMNR